MSKTPFPVNRTDLESCNTLYLAIEIANTSWLLGFATPSQQKTRVRKCSADCLDELLFEIDKSRASFGLPADCRVLVAFEAGFSGFWLSRALADRGTETIVLPSTILEDTGGRRRRKTDQIDVRDLVSILIRYEYYGERRLFNPVAVPSADVEDACRIHRERTVLKTEIGRHRNRIWGLLRAVGLKPNWGNKSSPIPSGVTPHRREQIRRELDRLALALEQLKEVEAEQGRQLEGDSDCARKARLLGLLHGIGPQGSLVLSHEVFWRSFKNRRQVGAFAGLTTVPHQSGTICRDGGISKQGNGRVRSLLIELSWLWLRYQPDSDIAQWYVRKFHGQRPRKIGIVAVARKLLIALWRFVEHGIVPKGARLKVDASTAA